MTDSTPVNPLLQESPERPRVLLIEPDLAIGDEVASWLALYDLEVLRVASGMAGFWTAVYGTPDVILCGEWEPSQTQGSYLDRLQSHPLTIGIPLIVMTCSNYKGLRRQMCELGVSACLRQPVVMTDLVKELRRHITLQPRRPKREITPAAAGFRGTEQGHPLVREVIQPIDACESSSF